MTPAFLLARVDRKLTAFDVRLYAQLHDELDVLEPRRVKQVALAHLLGVDQATVSRSLTRLLTFGYLHDGPMDGRRKTLTLAYHVIARPAA